MLSIIIPALNEEKHLSRLLGSIKRQGLDKYEVIVADANSTDRTVAIARKFKCKVVQGGLPAKGKNNGAAVAAGDLILFLDADSVLPDNCLGKSLEEYRKRNLQIATFMLMPDSGNKFREMLFDFFYNIPILVMEKILPHGAMGILIEKGIFEKINGFDETIRLAEDHYMTRRAEKLANFGIIRSSKIYISDRRFQKDGWLKTYSRYILCEAYMILIGPARSRIFSYKFGHYDRGES